MSVPAIARKDFQDAVRSRGLLLLTVVFVVLFAAMAFFFTDQLGAESARGARAAGEVTSDSFLRVLTNITRLLVPLIGIVVAYASVIGEQESGTLKLLLSLPHARLDVILGKFAGRSTVVTVPVVLGFLVAAPAFPLADIPFNTVNYAGFALLTVLLGVVFVALAVGASAIARTSRQAVVSTVVAYAFFTLLWGQITSGLTSQLRTHTELSDQGLFKANLAIRYFNPIAAYRSLTQTLSGSGIQLAMFASPSRQQYRNAYGQLPAYLSDEALVAYLLLWIVVALVAGYLVFDEKDL